MRKLFITGESGMLATSIIKALEESEIDKWLNHLKEIFKL